MQISEYEMTTLLEERKDYEGEKESVRPPICSLKSLHSTSKDAIQHRWTNVIDLVIAGWREGIIWPVERVVRPFPLDHAIDRRRRFSWTKSLSSWFGSTSLGQIPSSCSQSNVNEWKFQSVFNRSLRAETKASINGKWYFIVSHQ